MENIAFLHSQGKVLPDKAPYVMNLNIDSFKDLLTSKLEFAKAERALLKKNLLQEKLMPDLPLPRLASFQGYSMAHRQTLNTFALHIMQKDHTLYFDRLLRDTASLRGRTLQRTTDTILISTETCRILIGQMLDVYHYYNQFLKFKTTTSKMLNLSSLQSVLTVKLLTQLKLVEPLLKNLDITITVLGIIDGDLQINITLHNLIVNVTSVDIEEKGFQVPVPDLTLTLVCPLLDYCLNEERLGHLLQLDMEKSINKNINLVQFMIGHLSDMTFKFLYYSIYNTNTLPYTPGYTIINPFIGPMAHNQQEGDICFGNFSGDIEHSCEEWDFTSMVFLLKHWATTFKAGQVAPQVYIKHFYRGIPAEYGTLGQVIGKRDSSCTENFPFDKIECDKINCQIKTKCSAYLTESTPSTIEPILFDLRPDAPTTAGITAVPDIVEDEIEPRTARVRRIPFDPSGESTTGGILDINVYQT